MGGKKLAQRNACLARARAVLDLVLSMKSARTDLPVLDPSHGRDVDMCVHFPRRCVTKAVKAYLEALQSET